MAGLALIIAIGSQNVFVLRQGLRREHVWVVVGVCLVSDVVLIAAGAAGLGAVVRSAPLVVEVAKWGGAAFVLVYAAMAARRAIVGTGEALEVEDGNGDERSARSNEAGLDPTGDGSGANGGVAVLDRKRAARARSGALAVALATLALTWLNPHVYLDTVLLLGSIAATHGEAAWRFALGAILASAVWFVALGWGARWLGRFLGSPRSWRILDGVVAVMMIGVAVMLLLG